MKHTIKFGAGKALVIQPQAGRVRVELSLHGVVVASDLVDTQTAGLLSWGFEQATNDANLQAVELAGQQMRAA